MVVLLVLLGVGAVYFVFWKRPFWKSPGRAGLTNSQSVSFRQGTNVEFGTPTFASNGPRIGAETMDVDYNLGDINSKNRDFSNPMYDAVGTLEIQIKRRELYSTTTDTGKDTQKFVEEDKSKC